MNANVEPILYESHMHTPLCRHAQGEPEEYAAHAYQRGLKGIIVTCHGPTPYEWGHCMTREQWHDYAAAVERARFAWAGKLDVRLGVECDYMPDLEEYWREFLANKPLSHVLGSVHPQVGDYRKRYFNGNHRDYQTLYFEHLALAAETGLFDTISHPDLVKNESPTDWDIVTLLPRIQRTLDRIAQAGVAMELNTSGLLKSFPQMNPGMEMLREMRAREIPVVVGADAHVPHRAADGYEAAFDLLQEAGYSHISFFLDRQRQDVLIEHARASLNAIAP